MPGKRSKSQERERKRIQRLNQSEEQKLKVKEKDAEYQREKIKEETEDERNERNERNSLCMTNKREANRNKSVGDKRRHNRLKKGFGIINGVETSWIMKSFEEMSPDEKKQYNRMAQEWSREIMDDEKKLDIRDENKDTKYEQRFARFRKKRKAGSKSEAKEEEETVEERMKRFLEWQSKPGHKYPYAITDFEQRVLDKLEYEKINSNREDEEEEDTETDYENYWEDYEYEDSKRDGVLVFDKVSSEDLKAEAEVMSKNYKNLRKDKLNEPVAVLPEFVKCEYEKIRDSNIKERMKKMISSGLWTEDQLRNIPGSAYEKIDITPAATSYVASI